MKRILALCLTMIVMALAMLSVPTTATSSVHDYFWSTALGGPYGGGWKDSNCLNDPGFSAIFYSNSNLSGRRTQVCSWTTDLCRAPMTSGSSTNISDVGCAQLALAKTYVGEQVTSVSVLTLHDNVDCVAIYDIQGYSGDHVRFGSGYHYVMDMGTTPIGNDNTHAIKVVSADKCA